MKIRQGFVSNSSSSSFVIDTTNLSDHNHKILNDFNYYHLATLVDNMKIIINLIKNNPVQYYGFPLQNEEDIKFYNGLLPEFMQFDTKYTTDEDLWFMLDEYLTDYKLYKDILHNSNNPNNLIVTEAIGNELAYDYEIRTLGDSIIHSEWI